MKTYTKEEKKIYFSELRARWQTIKDGVTSGKLDEIKAIIAEHGLNVSPWSYAFAAASMKHYGFDGIQYLDCKTFLGWRATGFTVRKGEKSKISGIVWIGCGNKSEDIEKREGADTGYMIPKEYHLFHRSQVEERK